MNRRIAISVVEDDGLDAPMDVHFGRAPFFLVLDTDNEQSVKSVSNDGDQSVRGAGTRTAAMMKDSGVTDVISGQFGPKAYMALDLMKIRMWLAPAGMTAREARDEFSKGNLPQHRMKVYQ